MGSSKGSWIPLYRYLFFCIIDLFLKVSDKNLGNSVWGHQKGHGYLCTDTFFLHNRFIFKVSDKNLGNSERAIETFVTILHFHWIQWVMQHFLLSILFPCKIRIGLQDIAVKLNVWCQIIYSREGNLKGSWN